MLKTNEKQYILHAFDVLDVLVRVFVSWTTLLCIDDLVRRSFFFGVQRSD